MEREQIRISVRNLVEFILRSGDIDNRRASLDTMEAMQAGSRLHRKIQKKMGSTLSLRKKIMSLESGDGQMAL